MAEEEVAVREVEVTVVITATFAANLPASKITSERFPLARLPDGTLNYVVKGQGAGLDPVYGQVSHAELTGVTENQHHARLHALNSALDHSGVLDLAQLPTLHVLGVVSFNPASNISTSSATYVAIDATNFTLTLTVSANTDVLIMFIGGLAFSSAALISHYHVAVDDDIIGGSQAGIVQHAYAGAIGRGIPAGAFVRSNLTAGSHTFTPVFRTTAGTVTIRGVNTTDGGSTWTLIVLELKK